MVQAFRCMFVPLPRFPPGGSGNHGKWRTSSAAASWVQRAGVWHRQAGSDPAWRSVTPFRPRGRNVPRHAESDHLVLPMPDAHGPSVIARRQLQTPYPSRSPPWGQAPPPGVRPRLAGSDPKWLTPNGWTPKWLQPDGGGLRFAIRRANTIALGRPLVRD